MSREPRRARSFGSGAWWLMGENARWISPDGSELWRLCRGGFLARNRVAEVDDERLVRLWRADETLIAARILGDASPIAFVWVARGATLRAERLRLDDPSRRQVLIETARVPNTATYVHRAMRGEHVLFVHDRDGWLFSADEDAEPRVVAATRARWIGDSDQLRLVAIDDDRLVTIELNGIRIRGWNRRYLTAPLAVRGDGLMPLDRRHVVVGPYDYRFYGPTMIYDVERRQILEINLPDHSGDELWMNDGEIFSTEGDGTNVYSPQGVLLRRCPARSRPDLIRGELAYELNYGVRRFDARTLEDRGESLAAPGYRGLIVSESGGLLAAFDWTNRTAVFDLASGQQCFEHASTATSTITPLSFVHGGTSLVALERRWRDGVYEEAIVLLAIGEHGFERRALGGTLDVRSEATRYSTYGFDATKDGSILLWTENVDDARSCWRCFVRGRSQVSERCFTIDAIEGHHRARIDRTTPPVAGQLLAIESVFEGELRRTIVFDDLSTQRTPLALPVGIALGLCAAGVVTQGQLVGSLDFVRRDGRTSTYASAAAEQRNVSVTSDADRAVVWTATSVAVVDFDATELARVEVEAPDQFSAAALSGDGRTLVVAIKRGKLDVYALD